MSSLSPANCFKFYDANEILIFIKCVGLQEGGGYISLVLKGLINSSH